MRQLLRLRRDATLVVAGDDLRLRCGETELAARGADPLQRALTSRLAAGWTAGSDLTAGTAPIPAAITWIRRLLAHGWLDRRLALPDRPLLDVLPRGTTPDPPVPRPAGGSYRLSRFVSIAPAEGQLVASTPLSTTGLGLPDWSVLAVLGAATATALDQARVAAMVDVAPELAGLLLDELVAAAILVDEARYKAESCAPLALWSPDELRLHDRSRAGRHTQPLGATQRFAGRWPAAPLTPLTRPVTDGGIALPVPRSHLDVPLTRTIEDRASHRRHDDERPITLAQLAGFLFQVQRTTQVRMAGACEVARRPYPNGGGLCDLEIYPMVRRCAGLAAGLYHYDSHGHRLLRIECPETADADALVSHATAAAGMAARPQVLLVITARVGRTLWKYEGLGYAMTLKNAGVLIELMYLVATAMGLAACALGSGNSAAFARLSGIDPLAEPSVADLVLGSRPR